MSVQTTYNSVVGKILLKLKKMKAVKVKSKCLQNTCYSAAYISQTRDQQRFTISEVAAD